MLSINEKEFIFVEKYRPKMVNSLIFPESEKKKLNEWIKSGEVPNMLLSGLTPGCGKSSLAHVLINELGSEALFINVSLYPNIDTLRSKVKGFVSTSSFDGRPKLVILDEFDFSNQQSLQPAFRGFVEEFSKNARFILTANYKNKIIEPIRNRMINFDFDEIYSKNKAELIKQTAMNAIEILKTENISYNKDDIIFLVKHYYPSSRKIINKLQECSTSGKLIIDKDDIDKDTIYDEIIENIINKDFNKMRKNISKLSDTGSLFLNLYENIEKFPKEKQPSIIMTIAKYQSWESQVRDKLINTVALGTEILEIL
jgi:replication factor C small subunit